jgi:glycosyltransferase involved in cell wall biosynthesis
MVKICVINPFFYPYYGGIERRIYNIGKRQVEDNEVYVITSRLPGTKENESIDGIKVVRLKSRFFNIYNPPMVMSHGIYDAIKKLNPDIIDFHYRWALDYTRAVSKLSNNYPIIFTFHNDFGEGTGLAGKMSYINDLIFKKFLKKCLKIVCISDYVKNRLIDQSISAEKLVTIRNGIDISSHEKAKQRENDFFLFVGRLIKTKGIDYLLRAMAEIKSSAKVKLKICGTGPMLKKLLKLSRKLDIDVDFLGWVDEDKKKELMQKCAAFILPSVLESFGIVLLEAMNEGAPIIATKVGGIPEVVGESGLLVEPRSPHSLAKSMMDVHLDINLRRKLSSESLRRVKKFDWNSVAKKTMRVYEIAIDSFSG